MKILFTPLAKISRTIKFSAPHKFVPFASALAAALFLTGCATQRGEDHLQAVLWYQHAAEARALYYQAYNLASDRLTELTRNAAASSNKLAVIMDVDETVLNNGPFEARLIKNEQDFTLPTWDKWVNECKAERLPGAVDFLQQAASQHVEIFYITDRTSGELLATAANLRAQGFPMADAQHLLPADGTPGKQNRRQLVAAKGYSVVMLFGDSLPDFSTQFDKTNSLERAAAVDQAREEFGRKYIMLPNPMYGAWERLLAQDAARAGVTERKDFLNLPLPPPPPRTGQ
jgi:5'-nucleotidase (lipoprotein e(P4) family)